MLDPNHEPDLANFRQVITRLAMTTAHLTEAVLALPEAERLALAREIIASLTTDEAQQTAINEGVRRMEDIIKGQTTGLNENQFRQANFFQAWARQGGFHREH